MAKLKDFLITTIGKMEKLLYVMVIILWTVGTILTITTGMPWIQIAIIAMHICEFPIGWTVGKKAGFSVPYILVMHFTFGFTWWVPVLYKKSLGE